MSSCDVASLAGGAARDLPVAECRASLQTALLVTKRGGHIAHLQGFWPLGRSYLDDVSTGFFKLMLQQ